MSRNVALTIIFAIAIILPCGVMAAAVFASITALGRNPSAAPKILSAMTFALVFAESIPIIAFLVIWQLYTPK